MFLLFFFKQKTAYEMRISDWSSDVCSSDLQPLAVKTLGHDVACTDQGGVLDTVCPHPLPDRIGNVENGNGDRRHDLLIHLMHAIGADDERRRARHLQPLRSADQYVCRAGPFFRTEERRVGQACVSTCRYRWST